MKRIYDFEQFSQNEARIFPGDSGWQGSGAEIPSEAEEYLRKPTYDVFSKDGEWLRSGTSGTIYAFTSGKPADEYYIVQRTGGEPDPEGERMRREEL